MSGHLVNVVIASAAGFAIAPFVLGPPLVATLGIELLVAAIFRVGDRGLASVLFVNLVTNPIFNAVLFAFYALGIGIHESYLPHMSPGPPRTVINTTPVYWVIVAAMELAIVFVEWGLLVWALRRTAGSARKLLLMSVCMNAASAVISLGVAFLLTSHPA